MINSLRFLFLLFFTLSAFSFHHLEAFCGFYVARADATLYNNASRVVLVREGNRSVIGMMNDYKGELKDFAMVIPVPTILQKEQIHIGDSKVFDRIDAFTAPRLVEYFDPNPCREKRYYDKFKKAGNMKANESMSPTKAEGKKDLGVKVEATYTIGEYDIVILSAKFSDGLETWLIQNGYKIPTGASEALKPYISQKMKFFVAKVNLKEQKTTGLTYLRPIQFAFESEKFMLPIRLGMINSQGEQELLLYVLTKSGRVETTNYRTVKLPSNIEVPEFVKGDFANFYTSMFNYQAKKENMRVVFTEYFWDMNWCDPCASEPLNKSELSSLGVFWLEDGQNDKQFGSGANPVKVTRMHIKYSSQTFPEDPVFQQTSDVTNFQGRYIIRHPWTGNRNACSASERYFENLPARLEVYATNLANLTGWEMEEIRKKMNLQSYNSQPKDEKWWKKIWK
jgi:hypothetical protein